MIAPGEPLLEIDPMKMFQAAIQSKETRYYYTRRLGVFLDRLQADPREFLARAQENPKWAETRILEYIMELKGRVDSGDLSAATLPNYLKPIRLFLDMNDVALNWRKITRLYPRARSVAQDRAPTPEEVRALAGDTDPRVKVGVLFMASGGFRVGAWDNMRIRHITPILKEEELLAARLRVYADTPDEYTTYITPEAHRALQDYLKHREQNGEKITPDSPVLRNRYTPGKAHRPKPLAHSGISHLIERRLWKLGLRTPRQAPGRQARHEFQMVHGFRKFFNTRAEQQMKSLHVEMLMGHTTGLSDNYYRPTEDQILEDYLKAVPLLTLLTPPSPSEHPKIGKLEEGLQEYHTRVQKLEKQNAELQDALRGKLQEEFTEIMERTVKREVEKLSQSYPNLPPGEGPLTRILRENEEKEKNSKRTKRSG